jgi:glycosyltransferase A (GT-A) superfamily protein (DUF2064 family)
MTLTASNSTGTSVASSPALSVLTKPGAPTIGTATVTDSTHVSVSFTAPSGTGSITGYTVTSSPGSFTGTGSSSPITVTAAFVSGTAYTFTVTATNNSGTSVASAASNSVSTLQDGLTSATAAPSATFLADTGNTTNGIYWIKIPTAGATQIYCILDRAADGGGWMMAMKATRGTTFQYSSTHWTTVSTLAVTDTTRSDADAKFNTMNYSLATDIMALWPDITTSGGSLFMPSLGNFAWLKNNVIGGKTLIDYFNTASNVVFNSAPRTNAIPEMGTAFSNQSGNQFYGVNFTSYATYSVRWGFGWNNESDWGSNDVTGGIGLSNISYSAGDYVGCCPTQRGIERSARVEMYIRDSTNAPSAPTIGAATASGTTATVAFTSVAGASYYTAFSSTGGFYGSSTSSPITVTGMSFGTYRFTVKASNKSGTSLASSESNSVIAAYDGLTSASAAPSAAYLAATGNTTNGIYWITIPTAGATKIYCILDRAVDGGGWMMAMKATSGTTFQYSSTHWTTVTQLAVTDTTRDNADAKFDTMNYSAASDLLALWPDITTAGGSLTLTSYSCWAWLQNRFTSAGTFYAGTGETPAITTAPTGITSSMTLIDWFSKISSVRYFIQDAKTWAGWIGGFFSSQKDVRFYGFNYLSNTTPKTRWGFGWNENGGSLFPNGNMGSDDVMGGIGMVNSSYSAGDLKNCCQDYLGINRSARVEMYIRDSANAPSTPTIGTVSFSGSTVTVPFTGVAGASYYTAFSNTKGFYGSSTTSPITITGVATGTEYTFTVKASSASGTSLASSESNSITV